MKLLVDGIIYDSTRIPILLEFDENEQEMFNGLRRFVSAPEDSTEQERQELIDNGMREFYVLMYGFGEEARIVDFTLYMKIDKVRERVDLLNELEKSEPSDKYWFMTLYSDVQKR